MCSRESAAWPKLGKPDAPKTHRLQTGSSNTSSPTKSASTLFPEKLDPTVCRNSTAIHNNPKRTSGEGVPLPGIWPQRKSHKGDPLPFPGWHHCIPDFSKRQDSWVKTNPLDCPEGSSLLRCRRCGVFLEPNAAQSAIANHLLGENLRKNE